MESDVDVAMDPVNFLMGADNTTNQFGFGSNLCTGPQDRVVENDSGFDPAILSRDRATAESRRRVDSCRFVDR